MEPLNSYSDFTKYVPSDRPYISLSLDGGGVRGIIPLEIIHAIEKVAGQSITEIVDSTIGVSTGGILASALFAKKRSTGIDVQDTHPLFTTSGLIDVWPGYAQQIFQQTIEYKLKSGFGVWDSKYTATGLENVIQTVLNNQSLTLDSANLIKPIVLPSYDESAGQPVFFAPKGVFKSLDSTLAKFDKLNLADCMQATAAAPTYFPSKQIAVKNEAPHEFIDGGVVANNPALIALTLALQKARYENIQVISIGTGDSDAKMDAKKMMHAGLLPYAPAITGIFFQAMEAYPQIVVDAERVKRLQISNLKQTDLDDVSSIPYMQQQAQKWLQEEKNAEEIRKLATSFKLKDPNGKQAEIQEVY